MKKWCERCESIQDISEDGKCPGCKKRGEPPVEEPKPEVKVKGRGR